MPEVQHEERPDPLEWAYCQLAITADVLALHAYQGYGLCRCDRVWECDVYAVWSAYERYWLARLKVMEAVASPTALLPLVAA